MPMCIGTPALARQMFCPFHTWDRLATGDIINDKNTRHRFWGMGGPPAPARRQMSRLTARARPRIPAPRHNPKAHTTGAVSQTTQTDGI